MELPEKFAHSFIVRIRLEEAADITRQAVWRGQIEHIPGGERHYLKQLDEISSIILSYFKESPDVNIDSDRGATVSSIFTFLSDEPATAEDDSLAETPAMTSVPGVTEMVSAASRELVADAASPQEAMTNMLKKLREFLPDHDDSDSLPKPDVSVTTVSELPLAIGNFRGMDRRGSFAVAALKGGRLVTAVRFQLWANSPDDVNSAMDVLHAALLAAKDALWLEGFLRITAEASSPTEHVPSINGWRKSADYQVLCEFHYEDTEGAQSLIARIPIDVDSQYDESTVVTDEMVRWDNESTSNLVVRGHTTIGGLAILIFIPGDPPTGAVTLKRTFTDAAGPAVDYATLADFLSAVTNPIMPERHGQVEFDTFSDFQAAFNTTDDFVTLGNWGESGPPANYAPGELRFEPAIRLPGATDCFKIIYQGNAFNQDAILYLRATPG